MSQTGPRLVVGVPRETFPGEQRVALVPLAIPVLAKAGLDVVIERGAGEAAGFPDAAYLEKAARIVEQRSEVFAAADIILQVRAVGANPEAGRADLNLFRTGQFLIGGCDPLSAPDFVSALASRGVNCLALELLPRITRAQSMDILSSMATIIGYKAVLLAAETLPRIFPMLMTAAGTLTPAKVLIVGAGVAGLQAIATARRLGGVVQAYDLRHAVRQEVESLGARFVDLPLETAQAEQKGGYAKQMSADFYKQQQAVMAKVVAESDVVISTALVPGKPAPRLITAEMVQSMSLGSVIVDLAAERGGNCELTTPGENRVVHGVTILGVVNLASTVPTHASQMFSRNLVTFVTYLAKQGTLELNLDDEIVRDTLVTHAGEVVNTRLRELLPKPVIAALPSVPDVATSVPDVSTSAEVSEASPTRTDP